MKLLVVLAVIALVLWLARSARRSVPPGARRRREDGAEEMVRCARCGLHLPRSEALPGPHGVYCGAAHRSEHESELGRR